MQFKQYFTKKRVIWGIVALLALFFIWFLFIRQSANEDIQTAKVVRQNLQKTVLTTGQVVSSTDVSLSFQANGVVRRINVKEGDVVNAGQVLVVLDQNNALASLESARAALAQAEANYAKIKSPSTPEEIAVSQSAFDTASVSLQNAKQNLINEISQAYSSANTAVLTYTNILFSNPQSFSPQFSIPGTVQTNTQAVSSVNNARVNVNQILSAWPNEISSINETNIDAVVAKSLSNLSSVTSYLSDILNILTVYTQVTSGGSQTTVDGYKTGVTTAKSSVDSAYASLTSDLQAVKNAQYSLAQAQASLSLKKAGSRPEDVSIAEAGVLSAQGQVRLAEANLNNTIITAPNGGTITSVSIKLGEQAVATREVIKLLNVGDLYTEASVSESDIASIQVGQSIDNTFDAFGPDAHFEGKVLTVNPASTVISGVVNYKVTGSIENVPGIKPGMTANMTILVEEKENVLTVPSSAIINRDGKKFVRVIKDPKLKTYNEVEVSVGLMADSGLVELLGGIEENQEIVTYIK